MPSNKHYFRAIAEQMLYDAQLIQLFGIDETRVILAFYRDADENYQRSLPLFFIYAQLFDHVPASTTTARLNEINRAVQNLRNLGFVQDVTQTRVNNVVNYVGPAQERIELTAAGLTQLQNYRPPLRLSLLATWSVLPEWVKFLGWVLGGLGALWGAFRYFLS